jgi:hypothetical protein
MMERFDELLVDLWSLCWSLKDGGELGFYHFVRLKVQEEPRVKGLNFISS